MRKVVSSKEGYSLFFENTKHGINCVAYGTKEHMTGKDIADTLKISRSAVSQSLRRSVKKIFIHLKKRNISTIEIMFIMIKIFNIETESQYKKFFKLLPEKVRRNINATIRETTFAWY